MSKPSLRRCAVYTRKSSEEGLEQEFNSLDAQREAGAAYVKSQAAEGWRLVESRYDDGGISGGTLDRPGLQRLLEDIDAGRVHVVVVYKVDRLTRCLADFAKLVERFEKKGVSFVSVTQQFNTTTSMGRLMLNVLLSFAQFEREVTGERIRDKIAASKRKGMWMGGTPPIGYEANGRRLIVVEEHAKTVRHIFRRYTELGCITRLARELARDKIRTRRYTSSTGKEYGDCAFSRGHVHRILTNRMYLGQIEHHGAVYTGDHAAIIEIELWDQVQAQIEANRVGRKRARAADPIGLLRGKVFDDAGNPMTAVRTRKGPRIHRYYVSRAVLDQRREQAGTVTRVSAVLLEAAVLRSLQSENAVAADLSEVVRVVVNARHLDVEVRTTAHATSGEPDLKSDDGGMAGEDRLVLNVPFQIEKVRGAVRVLSPSGSSPTLEAPNPAIVRQLVRGNEWARWLLTGEIRSVGDLAKKEGVTSTYVSRLVRYAFMAPEISEAILQGTADVNLAALGQAGELPLDWKRQRQLVGI